MIELKDNILREETGTATVEYAIAGSLISFALVGAFMLLSGGIEGAIANVASVLSGQPG